MRARARLRIGLIGIGRMGALHLKNLGDEHERATLVGICDPRTQTLGKAAANYSVPAYQHFSRLLEEAKPDAIVIATPPASHPELVIEAALRGVHIFCEKPLALSREAARAASEAVSRSGVLFLMAFQRRFDRAYRAARHKVEQGAIGEPITFKAVARDAWEPNLEYARPEVSGGLLLDMAIHDFDLARWLMQSEVRRIYAEGSNRLYPQLASVGDIDNASVNLRFESGAIGHVEASRTGTYGYDIRTEIVGTRGALYVGLIEDAGLALANQDGFRRASICAFEERFAEAYRREMGEFLDCLLEERMPACSIRDGWLALEIALAASASLRDAAPVNLQPNRATPPP